MADPNALQDIVKVNLSIVQGSFPGGSVALAALVSTFAAPAAWAPATRHKLYSGSPDDILEAIVADGFTTTSAAYRMAEEFLDDPTPVGELLIGRRDAADATWSAAIAAVSTEADAANHSFALVAIESRTQADQLSVAGYSEGRWKFFVPLTLQPGALTGQAGTLVDAGFIAKYLHTAAVWHDAEEATGYGPAVVDGAPGTYSLENGQTLIVKVGTGLDQTFTFAATAATAVAGTAGPYTDLVDAMTILVAFDGLAGITITLDDDAAYFPTGIENATAAQLAEFLNDNYPQATWSDDAGKLRVTSLRKGTSSEVNITGGTAIGVAPLIDIPIASPNGTGDFLFADAATAAEVATKIDATATDFTPSAVGTRIRLSTDASGQDVTLTIVGGTAQEELGLELGTYSGTGEVEDWLDCSLLGRIAVLASKLDTPGGSFPLFNQKLRGKIGDALTATQRTAVHAKNANTYEPRTVNFPGELYQGVTFFGANIDFVILSLWLQLRLTEAIKALQDSYAVRQQRIPYTDEGIAIVDNVIQGVLQLAGRSGGMQGPDLAPFDPISKVTGYKRPTIAEQSSANKAAGKVSGWRTVQLDAGAIKAIEIDLILSTQ